MTAPTPDVEAIQSRVDRAILGPWAVDDGKYILRPDRPGFSTDGTVVATLQEGEYGLYETETAEFIAHSRQDIPALLDALAAVTTERDEAVVNARASQEMHEQARSLLDQTLTEQDKLQEQLADAPHDQ